MTLQNDDLFLVNRGGDSFKTEYGLIKQNILIEAGGATVSETPPDDPSEGDFWYHPGTDILSIWVTDEVTGVVTSIGTRSAGSGYTSNATDVETTGGTGVELTVDIDAGVGGNFANPSINKGGHGYKTGDVVFITGAGHGNGSLQVTGINTVAVGEWEPIGNSTITSGPTFPLTGEENDLFFNTTDGRLYIYYNDGSSSQWIDASPDNVPDLNYVRKTGDTMTGDLVLASPAGLLVNSPVSDDPSGGSTVRFNATANDGIVEGTAPRNSSYITPWGAYRNQSDDYPNVHLSKTSAVTPDTGGNTRRYLTCKHDNEDVAGIILRKYNDSAWFDGQATFEGNLYGGLSETKRIWNQKPSNFWNNNDYIGIGTSTATGYKTYGSLTTSGSFAVSLCGNGYRNDSGGWTRYSSATGENGGTEISLVPSGAIIFYSDTNKSTSTNKPTERGRFNNSGLVISNLTGSGNRAVYSTNAGVLTNSSSDITLKTNVQTLGSQVDVVKSLNPVSFNWIETTVRGVQPEIGFIAQEVQELVPEVVGSNSDGTLTVDYPKMVATLTKALQESIIRIEDLEAKVQSLEGGN